MPFTASSQVCSGLLQLSWHDRLATKPRSREYFLIMRSPFQLRAFTFSTHPSNEHTNSARRPCLKGRLAFGRKVLASCANLLQLPETLLCSLGALEPGTGLMTLIPFFFHYVIYSLTIKGPFLSIPSLSTTPISDIYNANQQLSNHGSTTFRHTHLYPTRSSLLHPRISSGFAPASTPLAPRPRRHCTKITRSLYHPPLAWRYSNALRSLCYHDSNHPIGVHFGRT